MSWKLILSLSLFGLAMGVGTVYFISSMVEPLCWLVIFLVCAYLIGKRASARFFVHGLCVGVVNGVWMTGAHVLLFQEYAARHPREIESMSSIPASPRLLMLIIGPMIGVASGAVLGLLSLLMARVVLRKGEHSD